MTAQFVIVAAQLSSAVRSMSGSVLRRPPPSAAASPARATGTVPSLQRGEAAGAARQCAAAAFARDVFCTASVQGGG